MVNEIARAKNDIFGWPLVGLLFKHPRALFFVRLAVLFLFVSAVYFGLVYPDRTDNPYTLAIFWSLFWPFFMIVSIILTGPGFCGICPHGTMGRWLTKRGHNKKMPSWMKHKGIGLTVLLLAYWTPVYLLPGFLKTPWVVALFFLALTLFAAWIYFRYEAMGYCSYLCPIGAVTKSYGKVGSVMLHTYQEACSQCKTFECADVCKFHLQPFLFEKKHSMRDCTLCMDCAQACEAVGFSIIPPTSNLLGTIKDRGTSHTWVYILLLAVITIAMRLHHGLGHSSLKYSLPWYQAGKYFETLMPIGIDWTGFFALLAALIGTAVLVLGGYKAASSLLGISFRRFLHENSYALAPMVIIGALSHIGTFFFVHYASNIANAWLWLIGSGSIVHPLASMKEGWVHLFSIFGYIGSIWSAVILYKRIQRYDAGTFKSISAWFFATSIVWVYLALLVIQTTVR
jgi:ferredoxin